MMIDMFKLCAHVYRNFQVNSHYTKGHSSDSVPEDCIVNKAIVDIRFGAPVIQCNSRT